MPRKKGKKLTKKSPSKSTLLKIVDQNDLNRMRTWLDSVKNAKTEDYQYDAEIAEINSSEDESEEFECNLKELEKPLKKLLKRFPDKIIKQKVNLECEWILNGSLCAFETTNPVTYINHVHDHLMAVDSEEAPMKCLWSLCKFETGDRSELFRHIDYHSYHTRLKTFGLGLSSIIAVPNCQGDSKVRNKIPPVLTDYYCHWADCSACFTKYHEFIDHVNHHIITDYQTGQSLHRCDSDLSTIKVSCQWSNCNRSIPNIFELKRHLKSHTNEKMIGCANCGHLFINKPLFINHCIRQVINQRSFQCTDCFKFYPSEKLLKDHALSHVNKFKCSFCGLSCQKQSVLARHIRYRHMKEKPFACDICEYKGKTKSDLVSHKNVHKKPEDQLNKCEVFQCNYTSKTVMALKRHDAKEHLGQPQTYQCHCCKVNFKRGYLLSKHLVKEHAFKLAPGHSRFIYRMDIDGYYRLQTKRAENFKKTAEPTPTQLGTEDSNMEVSYEVDNIVDRHDNSTPINVNMKRILKAKVELSSANEHSNDSKDINDFAVVRNYKKIIKRSQNK